MRVYSRARKYVHGKQTSRHFPIYKATQHNSTTPEEDFFQRKISCLRWDSNPRHSDACTRILYVPSSMLYILYTCMCMAKHNKQTLLALDAKLGPFSMIVCTRKSFSLAFLKNGCFSNSVAVGLENQTCKCTLQTYSMLFILV